MIELRRLLGGFGPRHIDQSLTQLQQLLSQAIRIERTCVRLFNETEVDQTSNGVPTRWQRVNVCSANNISHKYQKIPPAPLRPRGSRCSRPARCINTTTKSHPRIEVPRVCRALCGRCKMHETATVVSGQQYAGLALQWRPLAAGGSSASSALRPNPRYFLSGSGRNATGQTEAQSGVVFPFRENPFLSGPRVRNCIIFPRPRASLSRAISSATTNLEIDLIPR